MAGANDPATRTTGAGPLKLGIELTTREGRMPGGRAATWPEIRAMAKLAEQVGFETLFLEDHLLQRGLDYFGRAIGETTGFWDCWTLMGALAEATERVAIGPYVACCSFRNPALIAKMADTFDEISGGRLLLGLGAGWHEPEYDAFGFPFDHRVSRFEEALQIIVPLLREGRVDFQGRFYSARDCELRPRASARPNGPPIWIGGKGPRVLRLTARYADGYDTYGHLTLDTAQERYANLEAACRDVGRDPATIVRSVATYVTLPGPDGDLTGLREQALIGPPDELARRLLAFKTLGVEHLTCIISPGDIRGIERFAPVVEALRRAEQDG